jgi:hypothetical protein
MIIDFNSIVEDDEEIKSFKTYNNYLLSFRQCLESMYGKKPEIFKTLKDGLDTSYKKQEDKEGAIMVYFSYHWTNLGNCVLESMGLINRDVLVARRKNLPWYFE